MRIAMVVAPFILDLALQSYFHFTQLEALASAAVLFLVTSLVLRARTPSERSEPF